MPHKFTIVLFCFLSCYILSAQEKYDYQWMVGYPDEGDTIKYGAYKMDFNDDTLKLIKVPQATLNTNLSISSICDKNGKLILYSNGCQIHNGDFELVEGCENINPGKTYDNYCLPPYFAIYPTVQSELILPVPEIESQYFHLTQKIDFSYDPEETDYYTELYECHFIDMSLNNGKGKLIDHFTIKYPDVVKGQNLAACKHANGKDWWITNFSYNNEKFYRLLLTKDGISGPWEQSNGPPSPKGYSSIGQSVFSPDGKKYACIYSGEGKAWVLDFDRQTGLFSNKIVMDYPIYPEAKWGFKGISISPNNRFLYISAGYYLYQYDLIASNIQESRILVDSNDGYSLPGFPYYIVFACQQLAPDGKIYIGQLSGSIRQWSVINKPNELGKACDFKQHSLLFPVWSVPNVPLQPHFRLGPDTTTSTKHFESLSVEMKSWYNPHDYKISSWIQKIPPNSSFYLNVIDITNRVILQKKLLTNEFQMETSVSTSSLSAGIYFVQLIKDGLIVSVNKVVVY